MSAFNPAPSAPPTRYWKIPELFEFCISCGQADAVTFQQIIHLQPVGWVHGGDGWDRSSVWNRTENLSFLHPAVTWAELQLSVR